MAYRMGEREQSAGVCYASQALLHKLCFIDLASESYECFTKLLRKLNQNEKKKNPNSQKQNETRYLIFPPQGFHSTQESLKTVNTVIRPCGDPLQGWPEELQKMYVSSNNIAIVILKL